MPYVPQPGDEFYLQDDPYYHPQLHLEDEEKKNKIFQLIGEYLLPKQNVDRLMKQFLDEIEKPLKGNATDPNGFPMINTFVTKFSNDGQSGDFLGMDIGGSNLRIASVHLDSGSAENGKQIKLESYVVPKECRQGECKKFFDHLAKSIDEFLRKHFPQQKETMYLGFTFSFGFEQISINEGRCVQFGIQTNLLDAIGKCPSKLLQDSIDAFGLPVKVITLANDSTTTLIYGKFLDANTRLSLILGSGSNVAYIEKVENDKRIADPAKTFGYDAKEFIINSECVAYGGDNRMDYIKSRYDFVLDSQSLIPNSYTFEKMFGGAFLGELFRLTLIDLIKNGLLLHGKLSSSLELANSIETAVLSLIDFESICSCNQSFEQINSILINRFDYSEDDIELDDQKIITYVCQVITVRCGLLCAIELAPFINRMDEEEIHVSCDGSLYSKHPKMDRLVNGFLKELCPTKKTKVFATQNGGVIGSAMLAACYHQ